MPMMKSINNVTLRLEYVRDSQRSICFSQNGNQVWIERKQIQSRKYAGDNVFLITIPETLATKKKLLNGAGGNT